MTAVLKSDVDLHTDPGGHQRGLRTVGHIQLAQDVADMGFHRADTEAQSPRYLFVTQTASNKAQHLFFPVRQLRIAIIGTNIGAEDVSDQSLRHGRHDWPLADRNAPDALHDAGRVDAFPQESSDPGSQTVHHQSRLRVGTDGKHRGMRAEHLQRLYEVRRRGHESLHGDDEDIELRGL